MLNIKQEISNFFSALVNLFIFFPYFFSVKYLLKTLFSPWKNLVAKKQGVGFSFEEWANRLFFNLISRGIGFFARTSLLLFYLFITILYVISLPFLIVIFFLFYLPLKIIIFPFEEKEETKKQKLKEKFLKTHLLEEKNKSLVEAWFEDFYQRHFQKKRWWKLNNLFSYPPLARDWTFGYTPNLDQYSLSLCDSSYLNSRLSIVDRQKEIDQIERILSKSNFANVIIVGEEGVGKHTIVDALAKKIYEGKVGSALAYKRILKVNMEKILSEFTDEKKRENFFEELLQEAAEAKNVILLIDNIDHYLFPFEGRVDLTTTIEKFAKTDAIQFIGITEPFLYQKFIYPNEKINRLFEKVEVYEVSIEEAEKIILENFEILETRHQVFFPYETIKNAINKANFYITDIPFPEKAIDLLDLAAVFQRKKLGLLEKQWTVVLPETIDQVLEEKTHIPTSITPALSEKLLNLEKILSSQIIQQEEAINQLAQALRRSFLLLGKRKKPLASFLFLGPTGVGKTETAKAIAKLFFGSENYLLRFDMSLYQTKEDIKNLIGSMETGNPGLLTKAIREKPYGVLLLDELEKANRDLINIFLTLLDEGYFTDGFGKRVDGKNLVIIATSNAGADLSYSYASSTNFIDELINRQLFSPEFLNRFDGVVVFKPLTNQSILDLAKKMVEKIKQDLYQLYRVKIIIDENFLKKIVEENYNEKFGARNLERILREKIEDKLAKIILAKKPKEEEVIEIDGDI